MSSFSLTVIYTVHVLIIIHVSVWSICSLPPAGNPLASLSTELAQTNKITKEQLDQWKAKLESTLEAARRFESGNEDVTAWITTMKRSLDHEEGVRATIEGVQKQLEDAKVSHLAD